MWLSSLKPNEKTICNAQAGCSIIAPHLRVAYPAGKDAIPKRVNSVFGRFIKLDGMPYRACSARYSSV